MSAIVSRPMTARRSRWHALTRTARVVSTRSLSLLACLLALSLAPAVAGASPGRPAAAPAGPMVRAALVSESAGIEPGGHIWIGLHQRIAPGWHTYWINPGDSGEPATIDWTLPAGFAAGDIVWPHPERIPVDPLMSFGYSGETVLLMRISAPRGLTPGSRAHLSARASWLVCEKICIPEEANVE
jgi:thiol:disulfide interchange protein DsbD